MNNRVENIEIGDRVRSHDFDRERKCFIEGIVVGYQKIDGCPRYKILVDRKVWAGEEVKEPLACYVYPPINGSHKLFGGVCDGVEAIQ